MATMPRWNAHTEGQAKTEAAGRAGQFQWEGLF